MDKNHSGSITFDEYLFCYYNNCDIFLTYVRFLAGLVTYNWDTSRIKIE